MSIKFKLANHILGWKALQKKKDLKGADQLKSGFRLCVRFPSLGVLTGLITVIPLDTRRGL